MGRVDAIFSVAFRVGAIFSVVGRVYSIFSVVGRIDSIFSVVGQVDTIFYVYFGVGAFLLWVGFILFRVRVCFGLSLDSCGSGWG